MERKERPILFSGPMVCAILQGLKTQTRRIVKPQPREITVSGAHLEGLWTCKGSIEYRVTPRTAKNIAEACPYGQPGDRLWVRERWDFRDWQWNKDRKVRIAYGADGEQVDQIAPLGWNATVYGAERWRPSIHMPRWASRITLEVVSVRAQQLHDISEDDARAEGFERMPSGRGYYDPVVGKGGVHVGMYHATARAGFESLWKHINGPESWDANPWVWVVTFKRLEVSRG